MVFFSRRKWLVRTLSIANVGRYFSRIYSPVVNAFVVIAALKIVQSASALCILSAISTADLRRIEFFLHEFIRM
jgi:hypothetical protein